MNSPTAADDSENQSETKLPRRDWILLPLIGLFTLLFLAVSTELLARWLFPVSEVGFERCFARKDLSGTAPVNPNSFCIEQIAESRLPVEYRFDSRGHRADTELRPKQPGTYRIVMIGSSMAMGLFVPADWSFAATLPKELSQRTGRKIELYNEAKGGRFRGGPFPFPGSARNFKQVLAVNPDMILWIIAPMDIENADSASTTPLQQGPMRGALTSDKEAPLSVNIWSKLSEAISNGTLGSKLLDRWQGSRTSLVLKHFLLGAESQGQYVTSYLKNEDDAGFLRAEPNSKWQHFLDVFQGDAEQFEQQAKAAGVPFVAVLLPNRAQAAMISMGEWPQGYDPYKLDAELRSIVESRGGIYIDILLSLQKIPSPEKYYFPVDGHLNVDGHAVVSKLLSERLTDGLVPALRADVEQQTALEQRR
jgi:hypothetical protein